MKKSIVGYGVMLAAVPVAFIVAAFLSLRVTEYLSLWGEPIAGFVSALTVVLVGYVLSPQHKIIVAALWLLVGAIAAWMLLANSHYPENFGVAYAYHPTYIPLALTYLGGALGLFICYRKEMKNNV